MVLAASAAMLVAARGPQAVVAGVIIGLACVIWVLSPQGYSNITDTVAKSASYAVLDDPANGEARQSLGKALVVNQPLPIRAVVGSAYLWVFPVPFWHGFFTGSLYHILKSLHAVFAFFSDPGHGSRGANSISRAKRPQIVSGLLHCGFHCGCSHHVAGDAAPRSFLASSDNSCMYAGLSNQWQNLCPHYLCCAGRGGWGSPCMGVFALLVARPFRAINIAAHWSIT